MRSELIHLFQPRVSSPEKAEVYNEDKNSKQEIDQFG